MTIGELQLPGLPRLLGNEAAGPALQVVHAAGEGELFDLQPIRASYSEWRFTVAYRAQVAWPDGRMNDETIVITARLDELPAGIVPIHGLDCDAGGWLLPHDPRLPGLASATDVRFVRRLLDELEIGAYRISLETVSYSPTMHAVVEVTVPPPANVVLYRDGRGFSFPDPPSVLYLKVLRPSLSEALYTSHQRLTGVLPVPECLQWTPELGLLALEPMRGPTLWDCLRDDLYAPPSGDELVEVLDRMRDIPLSNGPPQTTDEVARDSATLLKSILPEEARRVDALMARLGQETVQAQITIHGDFHESQLLVGRDGISAVLDLDDAGPGQRIDDLAMMVGRLWSYAPFTRAAERVERYAEEVFESFIGMVDARELYRRAVSVAFSRATNPFRYQEENWQEETLKVLAVAEEKLAQMP